MQKTMTQLVREFHEKHGFDRDLDLEQVGTSSGSAELEAAAVIIATLAKKFEEGKPNGMSADGFDSRLMRAHLMLEELGEVLVALARRDLVKLADGLGDLDYVVHGTAVAYDIPLDEISEEIHRSNMTKAVRKPGAYDPRLRNKGDSYVPPDIRRVLQEHRR